MSRYRRSALLFLMLIALMPRAYTQWMHANGMHAFVPSLLTDPTTFCAGTSAQPVAAPDTLLQTDAQDDPASRKWLTFDLMLARQFRRSSWKPFTGATELTVSLQRKLAESWLWVDGSLGIAWTGGTDAEGHRAGPGTELVTLLGGLGHSWYFGSCSAYLGGGLSYAWAAFELPDISKPSVPSSESLDKPVYPSIREDGHFFGGYLRTGIRFHYSQIYFGVGVLGTLTTNQTLIGRRVNINSVSTGLFVGVDQ